MVQRSFKTFLAMGVTGTFAYATPALSQDSAAVQRQLEELRTEVQRLQQQLDEQSAKTTEKTQQAQALAEENQSTLETVENTQLTGALEFDGTYNDWSEVDKDTAGDLEFNKLILGIEGEKGDLLYAFQYRFYEGYRFLQHGWLGYKLGDNDTLKLGLVQAPFGNMDYGYLGWYGTLPYIAGFNDNQNAGIKWDHSAGAWDTSLAFFKSDQLGDDNEHYGANPIGESAQGNTAENQLAGRLAYTFGHSPDYATEFNLSAKGGQLYNTNTQESGDNWQAALGMSGSYGPWRTLLQATTYQYNAENPEGTGVSDSVIQIGAFDFTYPIPAEGEMYSASLGYTMDVDLGPVTSISFYNDYSIIDPAEDFPIAGFDDVEHPQLNDLGVNITAGPYYVWFDIITAKNALTYIGPTDNQWHTSFQTHFGLIF